MSDNRKYYYLKLKENFYNSETMVILESMQDGLLYSNLLLKMYLMSLKSGGILMLNDHLPHTPQTIATFTRHQVGTVERALKVFVEFGLVEILTDGAYYMADIQLLIGQSSTEGERKKKERMRLKRQKLLPSGGADICPPYSRGDICPPEIRDKRLDIRESKSNKSIEEEVVEYSAHARETTTATAIYLPISESKKVSLDEYFVAQLSEAYPQIKLADELPEIGMKLIASNYPCKDQTALQRYVLAWFKNKAIDLAERNAGIMSNAYDASALNEKILNLTPEDI